MYVDGVKDGTRTRVQYSPSPHFAPSELRGGTATHKSIFQNKARSTTQSVSQA